MSSEPHTRRDAGGPSGDLGVVDTSIYAISTRGRAAMIAVALSVAVLANVVLVSQGFWHWVVGTGATHFADYDPVALELPNNMAIPNWVKGETIILGTSTVGISLPTEKTEERLGRKAWTMWASGLRPVEYLAIAPTVVKAHPRDVLITLEGRMAVLDGETQFSRANRRAYVGPFNPAWGYHRQMSDLGWAGRWSTLPAVRFRSAFRVLLSGYLSGAVIEKRLPDPPAWKAGEAGFNTDVAQAALARYRAEPTLERYEEYLAAVGAVHEGIRTFWTEMRQAEPDVRGTGVNLQTLSETTHYLQEHGIRVSWFLYPENPIGAEVITENGRPMAPPELKAIAQRVFAEAARKNGVTFYDLLDMAPPDGFIDYTHLTPPASEQLGAALQEMFRELDAAQAGS